MQAGRYETGCPALAESYRLDPRPGVLFTLAECEREWGKLATALGYYNAYLSNYVRMNAAEQAGQAEREKIALGHQRALKQDVPQLTLALAPDLAKGARVTRDGVLLNDAVLGVALPVDPGEHHIKLEMPDGSVREWTITMTKAERRELTLSVRPSVEPVVRSVPPTPSDTGEHGSTAATRWTVTGTMMGIGVTALGVGIGFVFDAVSVENAVDTLLKQIPPMVNCGTNPSGDPKCAQVNSLIAHYNGDTAAFLGFTAFGVALAIAGVVVAVVWPKKHNRTVAYPRFAPRFAGLGVSF